MWVPLQFYFSNFSHDVIPKCNIEKSLWKNEKTSETPDEEFKPYTYTFEPYNSFIETDDDTTLNYTSFALAPSEYQPSGTINYSRYHENNDLILHARNYNILRIISGSTGLRYSN